MTNNEYQKQLAARVAPTKKVLREVISGLQWHTNRLHVDPDEGLAVLSAKVNDFVEILFFFHPTNVKEGKAEISLRGARHIYRGEEYTSSGSFERRATYTIVGANVDTLTKRVQKWIDSQSKEIAEHTARVITWQNHIDSKIEQNKKMHRLTGSTVPANPSRQRDNYPRRDWDLIDEKRKIKIVRNLTRGTYTLQVEDLTDDEVKAMMQALAAARSK